MAMDARGADALPIDGSARHDTDSTGERVLVLHWRLATDGNVPRRAELA